MAQQQTEPTNRSGRDINYFAMRLLHSLIMRHNLGESTFARVTVTIRIKLTK